MTGPPPRVFLDTSVLAPALIEAHAAHERCFRWLLRAQAGEASLVLGTHSLAETFALLSSWPVRPRFGSAKAWELLRESILPVAELVSLSGADYRAVLQIMANAGLSGGTVYDALAVRAAQKAKVDRLLTLNERDFLRVWPDGAAVISAP